MLTLCAGGSQIYVKEGEAPSPIFFFGPKNDKTIFPHLSLCEDLMEGLELMSSPFSPLEKIMSC